MVFQADLDREGAGHLDLGMFSLDASGDAAGKALPEKEKKEKKGKGKGREHGAPRVDPGRTPTEKTEAEEAKAKLRARIRQLNEWTVEAKVWPSSLKDSPIQGEVTVSLQNNFESHAAKFKSELEACIALAQADCDKDQVKDVLQKTDKMRADFAELVTVAKRLTKPAAKPKAKGKAKAVA